MIILQANEINFDLLERYVSKYQFSALDRYILSSKRKTILTSEDKYEALEPWIQWVSFYSGRDYNSHRVFHLGDYSNPDENDIFRRCVRAGKRLGIYGSMNHPGIEGVSEFIPDAWSTKPVVGGSAVSAASRVTSYLVNRNAQMTSPVAVLKPLLQMFFDIRSTKKYSVVIRAAMAFLRKDRVKLSCLFDFFFLLFCVSRHEKRQMDVSAIFLNGFAHVQHHYMISSEFVNGQNPEWYSKQGEDKLFKAIEIYDEMIGWLGRKNDDFVLLTGLSQEPYPKPEIYWRFKDHTSLLRRILPVEFSCVPKMTRDFVLKFNSENDLQKALSILKSARVEDDSNTEDAFGAFDISGNTLFCSFIYSGESNSVNLQTPSILVDLSDEIVFVAIKNGGHITTSWMFTPTNVSLENMPKDPKIWDAKLALEHTLRL